MPNGLEIVAECNGAAYSTAMGFFVKTGSRDETDDVAGVSHFLEHMVFKGTPTRSADDVNREFDEMGADYNAYTNEENTVFYAAVLPEYQDRAVELLADILRPALREDDFDTEKKVILEEIQMYEDQPPFGADDKCRAAYFGPHPLGQSVLGTAESVAALTAEAMRDYFRRRYSPGNIVLAAAGRVDFDALVAAGRAVLRRLGTASAGARSSRPRPHPAFACCARTGRAAICAATRRRSRGRRRRPLCRQTAGHGARRRLGQPALLGAGRSRAGRARRHEPRRASRARAC